MEAATAYRLFSDQSKTPTGGPHLPDFGICGNAPLPTSNPHSSNLSPEVPLPYPDRMQHRLVRYQNSGHHHFITFCCFHRQQHLGSAEARTRFERALERVRIRYEFVVIGHVVMPEHVHLLVTEPALGSLARAIQALKISVSRLSLERPFWQARYYDFNVITDRKRVEKLRYIHRNPVTRGLVSAPEDWPWSSYRHYCNRAAGPVTLETWWNPSPVPPGGARLPISNPALP